MLSLLYLGVKAEQYFATSLSCMFLDKKTLPKIWLKEDVTRDDYNDDFKRNTALQHCCDIVSNGHNIVPALQRCVALKIVVANPV